MNTRQQDILRILLTKIDGYFLVNDLAEKIGCSEKTIRNDLKKVEEYLMKYSSATLIRKPGLGVLLHIENQDKVMLYHELHVKDNRMQDISDEERVLQIAYQLLMSTKALSAQDLSTQYFVNRTVIKKDIEVIKNWLESFQLRLDSKQKIGLTIEGSEGDKRKALSRLSELINNVELTSSFIQEQFSAHEVEIVKAQLQELQRKHALFFTDESLENLLIHTLFMIKRVKLQQPITICETDKVQLQSKKEYEWTLDLMGKLEPFFAVRFPEDEIIYLALHILGGKFRYQSNGELVPQVDLTENNAILADLLEHLLNRMSELHAIDFWKDQTLIDNLKVHLYTTLNRLQYGLVVSNPLLGKIKNMYPYMFHMVISSLEGVIRRLPFAIPEEEAGYLTLHFQASVERFEKNAGLLKKAVIVCHMGIGMSQLLRTKIERNFPSIQVKDCIAKDDLNDYLKKHKLDLIISTIELKEERVPLIVVSPLLTIAEENCLKEFIKQLEHPSKKESKQSTFMIFTNPFLIFLQKESSHRYQIIEELATVLFKKGYVEEEYVKNVVMREKMSSTNIGAGIAIPHGSPKLIKQSAIAIATLQDPLNWGTEKVSLVFMMAVKNDKPEETKQLFRELSYLCEQPEQIQSLIKEKDTMVFLEKLNHI